MENNDYLLRTENLFKWFPTRIGILNRTVAYVKAVDGVSIGIRRGETFGLVGESGCGKTTLGRTLMRLTEPSMGSFTFEGTMISALKGSRLKPFRRKMQVVFQDPYASLDPRQSIGSALLEPMKIHRIASTKSEAKKMAGELLEKVGLNTDHIGRFPHEFSGGQRQRIAIAIALAVKPSFIVLDEPTSALDVSVQAQILRLLRNLQQELDLTFLFISHNLAVIRQMCDRTAVMYLGRIVEFAETKKLFENPKHPYTKALLSSVPVPDPSKRRELRVLQGNIPSPVALPSGCRCTTRCAYPAETCLKLRPPLLDVESGHCIQCHYDIDFAAASKVEIRPRAT